MKGVGFGPHQCISLYRSEEGTCMLSLDCDGIDNSKTEFAFNCVGKENIERHSFGFGGFDANEEFDTGIVCDRCEKATPVEALSQPEVQAGRKSASPTKPAVTNPPKSMPGAIQPAAKESGAIKPVNPKSKPGEGTGAKPVNLKTERNWFGQPVQAASGAVRPLAAIPEVHDVVKDIIGDQEKDPEPQVVKYGPSSCVSVYKNKAESCVMATDCKQAEISNYEFGLVCVDKVGAAVKHLFGKGSFDGTEIFDTQIRCDQCLGLESVTHSVNLTVEVARMKKDLSGLKDLLSSISSSVQKLNDKVFAIAAVPTIAPVADMLSSASAALVHKSASHHKHHLRHSHRRHYYDDDDDYDEEEGAADASDDQEQAEEEPQHSKMVTEPIERDDAWAA